MNASMTTSAPFPVKALKAIRLAIPKLASLKISVACLVLLLILTAWGTVYQASYGLHAAQVRFFYSWYFLVGGFIPLPGAQLVMWVLFFNLVASMLFRVRYSWDNAGNVLTHGGFLFLLAGSFVTYHYAQESYLPLAEKAISNVSLDRRQWELAVWEAKLSDFEKQVSAVSLGQAQVGGSLAFPEFGFEASVRNYYRNCEAFPASQEDGHGMEANAIGSLAPKRPALDPEENVPGATLIVRRPGEELREVVLFGGMSAPARIQWGDKKFHVALRRLRHPLPIAVKLIDVKKEEYPGTGIARAYQSDVVVRADGAEFKSRISMNHPLHYKDFTFYQSSYSVDEQGRETSVLAVVENKGKLLPYISGTLIFIGMLVHFLLMLFRFGTHGHAPAAKSSLKTEALNGNAKGAKQRESTLATESVS
jgi:ResB-like family